MKKVLLAGTALVGAALATTPAHADLKLDLGGYFRGYAVYSDNDEIAGAGEDLDNVDIRRDTEVQFTGETTTDAGLTVGVHTELKLGDEGTLPSGGAAGNGSTTPFQAGGATANQTDEAYAYFSGGWGRVNFGSEDGAAYLLQVAAPSADSNVDGLRVYVQSFASEEWNGVGVAGIGGTNVPQADILGYDNAPFRNAEKLTYLTPKWNGFQAGISYAPNGNQEAVYGATASPIPDLSAGFKNAWEAAARWDGEWDGFGISFGGGYAFGDSRLSAPAGAIGSDDLEQWDVGLNVTFQDFSLGAAYKTSNTGVDDDGDVDTWVVGGAWDNGPYHVGLSWADYSYDTAAFGAGSLLNGNVSDVDLDRYTLGGGYTYGPGMTFRGSVAYLDVDSGVAGGGDPSQWQVAIGTDINF